MKSNWNRGDQCLVSNFWINTPPNTYLPKDYFDSKLDWQDKCFAVNEKHRIPTRGSFKQVQLATAGIRGSTRSLWKPSGLNGLNEVGRSWYDKHASKQCGRAAPARPLDRSQRIIPAPSVDKPLPTGSTRAHASHTELHSHCHILTQQRISHKSFL